MAQVPPDDNFLRFPGAGDSPSNKKDPKAQRIIDIARAHMPPPSSGIPVSPIRATGSPPGFSPTRDELRSPDSSLTTYDGRASAPLSRERVQEETLRSLLSLEHGSVTPDQMQQELGFIYRKAAEDFGPCIFQSSRETGAPRSFFLERRDEKTFATIVYNKRSHGDPLPFSRGQLGAFKTFKWGVRFDISDPGSAKRILVSSQKVSRESREESRILVKLSGKASIVQLYAGAERMSKRGEPKALQVFEYYGHGDLYDHLYVRKAPGSREGILSQLKRAIHSLHKRGIAHRDIKEKNMFALTPEEWSVGDLGAAIDSKSGPERRGVLQGTPVYMAPELIRAGQRHYQDPRNANNPVIPELLHIDYFKADAWSFGVMALKMLSERNPYWKHSDARSTADAIAQLKQSEVDRHIEDTTDPEYHDLLKGWLQVDPRSRASI